MIVYFDSTECEFAERIGYKLRDEVLQSVDACVGYVVKMSKF